MAVSFVLASCEHSERDLGDNFILYKGDSRYPLSIGLNVSGGGVQGLLDGDIVAYGFDSKCITIKIRNDEYFYIEKMKILKDPAEPTNRGKGPFSRAQFDEMAKAKGLPPLGYKP